MRALKAHVETPKLIVDDPTDLPEGAQVHSAILEGDTLDQRERDELHASIEASEAELDAGQAVTEEEFWTRLRQA